MTSTARAIDQQESRPTTRRCAPALLVASGLLGLLVVGTYGPTLSHDFVFDDRPLVADNPAAQLPLREAWRLFDPAQPGVTYRPVRIFSYMVDHHLAGGTDARAHRAANLLDHWLVAVCLLFFGFRLGLPLSAALAGAAIFAVHPLGSEAVVYVSGRRDLLAALFAMLALLLLQRATDPRDTGAAPAGSTWRPWSIAGAVGCTILAVGAKESAVVIPLLGLLIGLLECRRSSVPPAGRVRGLAALVSVLLAVAATVVLSLYRDVIAEACARSTSGRLVEHAALVSWALGTYVLRAIWPAVLLADYTGTPLPRSWTAAEDQVHALLVLSVLVGGVFLLRRGSVAGLGLLWFLVALLPVAQIVPYREVAAEHNAYLALAGLSLAAAAAIARGIRDRQGAGLGVVWMLVAALVLGLGWRAAVRSRDWKDDVTLWSATVRTAPGSARAHHALGVALLREGRPSEARAELERAVAIAPRFRDALLAQASVESRLGRVAIARDLVDRALRIRRDARALVALAWIHLREGDRAAATAAFQTALAAPSSAGDARARADAIRGLSMLRDAAPTGASTSPPDR